MRLTSMLAIYILFWAFSLFLVLPFGVRTSEELGKPSVPGQAESAPHVFPAGKIALRTTILSLALFTLYYVNYVNGWIGAEAFDFFPVPK